MSLDLQFEMSECLGPSLSVYSSYLVIYSSSLVIYSCSLLDAFIKGLFKFFIHMTDYFLYLCKYLAIIILQKLGVLFLKMFFHANGDCMLQTLPYLFMGVL